MSLSKKNDEIKENEKLKKEISNLQKAVSDLSMNNIFLEKSIKVTEREFKVVIKKTLVPDLM